MREYFLFLITDDEVTSDYLSNKHLVYGGSLDEIDEFTRAYKDAQDLGNDINVNHVPRIFRDAVIVSKSNLFHMINNHDSFPKKEEKVLFESDKEFIEQKMSMSFYDDILIDEYKNFLLAHRREIGLSLVRHVKMGVLIDETILNEKLEQVFYAYYKSKSYKKIRDTYIDLKKKKKKYKRVRQ